MNDLQKIYLVGTIAAFTVGCIATSYVKDDDIRKLQLDLQMERQTAAMWKRNYRNALKKMNVSQLLEVCKDRLDDIAFENIVKHIK